MLRLSKMETLTDSSSAVPSETGLSPCEYVEVKDAVTTSTGRCHHLTQARTPAVGSPCPTHVYRGCTQPHGGKDKEVFRIIVICMTSRTLWKGRPQTPLWALLWDTGSREAREGDTAQLLAPDASARPLQPSGACGTIQSFKKGGLLFKFYTQTYLKL